MLILLLILVTSSAAWDVSYKDTIWDILFHVLLIFSERTEKGDKLQINTSVKT
jgi:hypothetical protein